MFSKLFNKKNIEKRYKFQTRDFIITLEPGWVEYNLEQPQLDDPLSFVKEENGTGALQISLATAKHGEKFDIHKFLERGTQSHIDRIKQYKLREWIVYEYEDQKDEMFIKFINLIKFNVHVFATYTCVFSYQNKNELNEAIKIIKTIKVVSNN